MKQIDTLIIGGGQAGLAMSRARYHGSSNGFSSEAESGNGGGASGGIAPDPDPAVAKPTAGVVHRGPDPDGFMTKDELVRI
jgi:hypothetical protein